MKKYRDEIAEVCHEIVEDGYQSGIINAAELREFEADCFVEENEAARAAKDAIVMDHVTA